MRTTIEVQGARENNLRDVSVEIPAEADSARYRISGNATGNATSGSLVHHGWQAKQCELPKWTGSEESALIVFPAELEVK